VQINPSKDLLKECMMILETNIPEFSEFKNVLSILQKLISNIYKDPNDEKFHRVKLNNEKIKNTVGKYPPALFLLELVGFRMIDEEEQIDAYTIQKTKVYKLDYDAYEFKNFELLNNLISEKMAQLEVVSMENERRKKEKPYLYANSPYSVEKISDPIGRVGSSVWDQLRSYREQMKEKNMYRVSKEINIKDSEKMQSISVDPNYIKSYGIRCLELTNTFRETKGLPALEWNEELYRIGMKHSKKMAKGEVPIGHDGFHERIKEVKFSVKYFSENVAYNENVEDPCKTAITGWIKSPIHRMNMLSESTHCAISVYCLNGRCYFTQLFALC
jgi:uncharacterized protein YkwD